MATTILTLDIGPVTIIQGTGHHPPRYVAWIRGQEHGNHPRGWGQTQREAELDLQKQTSEESNA
jgi:hypothetical protein